MKKFDGLIAATFSPMTDRGDLDPKPVPQLVDHLVGEGVAGLFVAGSTGEGASLSIAERRCLAEAYVTAAAGRLPVIVQIGHDSLREAAALAAHAAGIGADALGIAPPSYFRPASLDDLVECLAEVTAAAPHLPLYYYHIPRMTGVDLDMIGLLQRVRGRLEGLKGIKFSAADIAAYQACVDAAGDEFDILFGCDEMLLSGLCAGGRAAVGSTYNFAAPLYHRIMAAFAAGEIETARREQQRAVEMVRVLLGRGGLPAIKATMGLVGIECGPGRLPLRRLTGPEIAALRHDLERIGFFDWARH